MKMSSSANVTRVALLAFLLATSAADAQIISADAVNATDVNVTDTTNTSDLNVSGATNTGDLNVSDTTNTGDLNVSGTTNTGDLTANVGTLGTVNTIDLNVSGAISLSTFGVTAEELNLSGSDLTGIGGISADGGDSYLEVGTSNASLQVQDQSTTGNNGIAVTPTQTSITGGSGDPSLVAPGGDTSVDNTSLTLDASGVTFGSTATDASLDMGGHTISNLGDGTLPGDAVNLDQLEGAVSTETDRAVAAENANTMAIGVEQGRIDDNVTAIGANTTAITDEATTARAAEGANTMAIDVERGRIDGNVTAIDANQTAITNEANTARANEMANQTAIDAETKRAEDAEAINSHAISMERARLNSLESGVIVGHTETTIRSTGGKSSDAQVSVAASSAKLSATSSAGESMVMVDGSSARVLFQNGSGGQSGLVVGPDSTTLSGGSSQGELVMGADATTLSGGNGQSTRMRMDADGVTFERVEESEGRAGAATASGAPAPVHGVAAGKADTDAVNRGQLDDLEEEAFRGIAISNAMEVFLPDPGKKFRVNMGVGYYKDKTALGLTGSGRITENIGLYIGAASDSSFEEVGGKAGVSFQW